MSWQRLVYYLGLALVEATPPALLLLLVGGDAWLALIAIVLVGALADWVVLRRLPERRQRPALGLLGLVAALWLTKSQVGGGLGLLGGWGAGLAALAAFGEPRSSVAYIGLLAALYCFWRGTRLTLHDHRSLHRLFRTVTVVLLVIVGFGFLTTGSSDARTLLASRELLTFFVAGLLTIALSSATEERDAGLHRLGWRGTLTLLVAIGLVLALGLALGALAGHEVRLVVQTVWHAIVLILALILAPFIYLMVELLDRLLDLMSFNGVFSSLVNRADLTSQLNQFADGTIGGLPTWLTVLIQGLCALVPVLVLLALFWLARRRNRRQAGGDEERESLWSWQGMAQDLRGLLARRRAPTPGGLRELLARMRGADPVSRIRRSYIRLLLLGEEQGQPRAAPQTPREYGPVAGTLLPGAHAPIATLTEAYERARYNPAGADAADAAAAEQAWAAIDRAERPAKPRRQA